MISYEEEGKLGDDYLSECRRSIVTVTLTAF